MMSLCVTPWRIYTLNVVGLLASQVSSVRAEKSGCGTMNMLDPPVIFEQFKEDFQNFRSCFIEHCKIFQKNTCADNDIEYANFYQKLTKASKFDLWDDEILKIAAVAAEKGFFCYILNKNDNLVQVVVTESPEC